MPQAGTGSIEKNAVRSNGRGAASALLGEPRPRRRRMLWAAVLVAVAVLLAGGYFALRKSQGAVVYETAPVSRADLTQTVTASGTVNPQDLIAVGTQVSGTIQSLYVDYNSKVYQGEVLARLDPSQFQAQVDQARATVTQMGRQAEAARQSAGGAQFSVQAANAAVVSARSDVAKTESALVLARQTLARDRALLRNGYISQSQYDADYSTELAAEAAVRAARASVSQTSAQSLQSGSGALQSASSAGAASAAVSAAQAALAQDELNLQRTVITSPVNGTVVARNVSVGQTVAASFQTPTLFSIARDLRKMEVDIAVGEPDIGGVVKGAPVDFAVLAYPNRTFHGRVQQVRVNPTTVSNVVTYTVTVLVENLDGKLLPGMTANTSIRVGLAKHALVVPVEALSYRPAHPVRARRSPLPGATQQVSSPWGATGSGVPGAVIAGTTRPLFVLKDGKPQPVRVRIDLVSGMRAAVTPVRGTLRAGDQVVTADNVTRTQRSSAAQANAPAGFGRMVH